MRYSVDGKIPPEHFFQSFGMKMPKGYTGENVNADGVAEKPEITDPEPMPREENPSQPGNIGDIPFDNAPSSEDDKPEEEPAPKADDLKPCGGDDDDEKSFTIVNDTEPTISII